MIYPMHSPVWQRTFALLTFWVLLSAVPFAAAQTTFTVTKIADTNDGACDAECSLREALAAADASGGADTIVFDGALSG